MVDDGHHIAPGRVEASVCAMGDAASWAAQIGVAVKHQAGPVERGETNHARVPVLGAPRTAGPARRTGSSSIIHCGRAPLRGACNGRASRFMRIAGYCTLNPSAIPVWHCDGPQSQSQSFSSTHPARVGPFPFPTGS